jgi:hypothetical protein
LFVPTGSAASSGQTSRSSRRSRLRAAKPRSSEKDTPILEELAHILGAADIRHVVVIDDARLFGTDPAYPTLDTVAAFVTSRSPQRRMIIDCDGIQILPG